MSSRLFPDEEQETRPKKKRKSRLQFDEDKTGDKIEDSDTDSVLSDSEDDIFTRKRKATDKADDTDIKKSRMRFDDGKADDIGGDTADEENIYTRKRKKAEQKTDKYSAKAETARENLPTKRKLKLERSADDVGNRKTRLVFDKEVVPRGYKGSLPSRAVKSVAKAPVKGIKHYAHRKIREVEDENVGTKATHKTERLAEYGIAYGYKHHKRSVKDKPYRQLDKQNKKVMKERAKAEYYKVLEQNPDLHKKSVKKFIQKQRIKRQYANAYREAKYGVKATQQAANIVTAVAHKVVQVLAAHKTAVIVIVLAVAVFLFIIIAFMSSGFMLAGVGNSVVGTMYTAEDEHINDADLYYSELETDLQEQINNIEEDYPDYDEYNYYLDPIGHSPYELLAYLSARFNDFEFSQIKSELDSIFAEMYTLTFDSYSETRGSGEDTYTVWILDTTLTVKPLAEIIEPRLLDEDMQSRYEVYMQTLGARQTFGNPFRENWINNVSSPYGYRIHPITGEKSLHRGIDIAYPRGTPIYAVHDGTVITSTYHNSYGNYVVIEDDEGYISKYAHCDTLLVNVGDVVTKETQIGTVGTTGDSTGNHLHLEVLFEGQYLNPAFFVETGANEFDIEDLLN